MITKEHESRLTQAILCNEIPQTTYSQLRV